LGKPQGFLGFGKDPALATVCGLVLEGADLEIEKSPSILRRTNLLSKLKRVFKIFTP
jgi:hypothetical protein